MQQCIAKAMSSAIGTPIVHDFALSKTLVYPTKVHNKLRSFIENTHGMRFEDFVLKGRKQCRGDDNEGPKIPVALYEINLLGAFLW